MIYVTRKGAKSATWRLWLTRLSGQENHQGHRQYLHTGSTDIYLLSGTSKNGPTKRRKFSLGWKWKRFACSVLSLLVNVTITFHSFWRVSHWTKIDVFSKKIVQHLVQRETEKLTRRHTVVMETNWIQNTNRFLMLTKEKFSACWQYM